ncbi:probable transmembrane protein [hydrothermal vent metagenome]|uniref:Probable transmembrane protein n=1 Tax=hydrothermal vent metagenome TaxID=652676 RepID=A0A1W1EKR8_9ZZZZ
MKINISIIILSSLFFISCGNNSSSPINNSIDINKIEDNNQTNSELLEEDIINNSNSNIDNNISQNQAVLLSPTNYKIPFISSADKIKYLEAINLARSEAKDCGEGVGFVSGANPLTWNDDLFKAAFEHNYDMTNSNTFAHSGSGTIFDITGTKLSKSSNTEERIRNNHYLDEDKMVGVTTAGIGENLAGGQPTIEEAINSWINSPLHCKNLMDTNFKEMAISKVKNPNFREGDTQNSEYYWTHIFGYKNR